MAEIGRLASGLPTLSFDNRYRCKDGTYRDLHWTSFPEPNSGLVYAVARDMSERRLRDDQTDRLTGVATRRKFDSQFAEEWSRATRLRVPLAVGMVDVDFLKQYNEIYGHSAGDECLRQLAKAAVGNLRRAGDLVARYEGGSFIMIMAGGLTTKTAAMLCDRIREAIGGLRIPNPGAADLGTVTVSGGAASLVPSRDQQPHDLLHAVDAALYQAKQHGRNRVQQFLR